MTKRPKEVLMRMRRFCVGEIGGYGPFSEAQYQETSLELPLRTLCTLARPRRSCAPYPPYFSPSELLLRPAPARYRSPAFAELERVHFLFITRRHLLLIILTQEIRPGAEFGETFELFTREMSTPRPPSPIGSTIRKHLFLL